MAFKKTTTSEKIRPILAEDEDARKAADQAKPERVQPGRIAQSVRCPGGQLRYPQRVTSFLITTDKFLRSTRAAYRRQSYT